MAKKHNWIGWSLGIVSGLLVGFIIVALALALARSEAERAELHKKVESLTTQNRGPAGEDGKDGANATPEQIAAAVAEYCAARNQCIGPQGPQGVPGAKGTDGKSITGPTGATGASGTAGLGITRVACGGTYIDFYAGPARVGRVSMVCIP